MGGMNLGSGFAAGAGADELQDVLKNLFERANANKIRQQEQQRIGIEQQRADDEKAYRTLAVQNAAQDKADRQQAALVGEGERIGGSLAPGADVTGQTNVINALTAAGLGPQHQGATLASTAMQGGAMAGGSAKGAAAPTLGPMATTANAGHGEQDIYQGTAAQQQGAAQLRAVRMLAAKDPTSPLAQWVNVTGGKGTPPAELFKAPDTPEDVYQTGPNGQLTKVGSVKKGSHIANAPTPPQTPLVMVQTVDENGNPITKIVKKEAGAEYTKPANATTANRVASAEAVNKVGNDIVAKLSDPKYAAVVGPAMGRASSLQDFIGNPPPEFAELAGEIESYALANMGVHGMRSAQGAEAIKKMLDGRHTPESLIATVKGLQNFSNTFVAGNKPKAGGAAASAPASAAPPRIKYDMNGNPIKD